MLRRLLAPVRIRTRIAVLFTAACSFLISVTALATYFSYAQALRIETEDLLFSQFLSLTSVLENAKYDAYGVKLSSQAVQHVQAASSIGIMTVLRDTQGLAVSAPEQLDQDVVQGRSGYFFATVDNQPFIFYGGRFGRLEAAVGVREDSYLLNKLALRANILAFIVATSTLFALFVSYLVTARVLSPVRRLAEMVEKADPEKEMNIVPIAASFPDDEIGYLAQSFDRFMTRIRNSIIREKEFVSDAGHELRTPLTVIRTSAELLLASDGMSEKAQAKLRNILAAADKMDRLSSGLLELRKESRTFAEPEEVRFPELLYDMSDPLLPFLAEKGVRLEVADLPGFTAMLPVSELEKVVTNLIRNAAIHSGSDKIVISATNGTVRIRDYGVGIPDSEKQKIFGRFYRTDKSRPLEGFGLGLAIVKKIADREKWHVSIADPEGGGAEFVIRLS